MAWFQKGAGTTRKSKDEVAQVAHQFDPTVMEALVPGPLTAAEANALIHGFKKAVFERALGAELTHHLGYSKDQVRPAGRTNHRNGASRKTVITGTSAVHVLRNCSAALPIRAITHMPSYPRSVSRRRFRRRVRAMQFYYADVQATLSSAVKQFVADDMDYKHHISNSKHAHHTGISCDQSRRHKLALASQQPKLFTTACVH